MPDQNSADVDPQMRRFLARVNAKRVAQSGAVGVAEQAGSSGNEADPQRHIDPDPVPVQPTSIPAILPDSVQAALDAWQASQTIDSPTHAMRPPSPKDAAKGLQRAVMANRRRSAEVDAVIGPTLVSLRSKGLSLRAIAAVLAEAGIKTRRGGRWSPQRIAVVLKRVVSARSSQGASRADSDR